MIFRTVGPSLTPVWCQMLMRLFPGDDAFGDDAFGNDPARGVTGTPGRMMGDVWFGSAVNTSGAVRLAAGACCCDAAYCCDARASRARVSAVGVVVMLLVRAITRGGRPSPGLAMNRMVPDCAAAGLEVWPGIWPGIWPAA